VSGPSLLPDAVPRVTYPFCSRYRWPRNREGSGPTPVARAFTVVRSRFKSDTSTAGHRLVTHPTLVRLILIMSEKRFRPDATLVSRSAELQQVGPFLGIVMMFEAQEPTFLSTR
jgi:hypothetical protein